MGLARMDGLSGSALIVACLPARIELARYAEVLASARELSDGPGPRKTERVTEEAVLISDLPIFCPGRENVLTLDGRQA
jgi:hypothetical protein